MCERRRVCASERTDLVLRCVLEIGERYNDDGGILYFHSKPYFVNIIMSFY